METTIFDTLLEAVFVVDNEFKVTYCNEPAAILADVSIRKLVRQRMALPELFAGLVLEKPIADVKEQVAYKEAVFTNQSGTECRIQWTVQPFGENHWLVFFRDVTLEERLQKKYRAEIVEKEVFIDELKKAKMELENYSKNLEKMVAERTAEIQSMNKTMKALLDSLHQGFFIFNPDGKILPVYSKACVDLYGRAPDEIPVWSYLNLTEKEVPGFKKWTGTLFSELLPFDDLTPLGPAFLDKAGERTIKLDYYPIRNDDNTIEAVVVMATDITALVEAQQEAAREKSHAQFILKLIQQQKEVLRFVHEAKGLLAEINANMEIPWEQVDKENFFRLLHTLKGGSASFSGEEIAEHCHHAEDILSELKFNQDPNLITKMKEALQHTETAYRNYSSQCQMILGPLAFSTERHLQIAESELLTMVKDLKANTQNSYAVAEKMLNKYLLEPVSSFFTSYDDSLSTLAKRLDKEIAPIKIYNGEILVWGEFYQPIFATFVHLFRNALDHGLETSAEREQNGKSPKGNLAIEFELAHEGNGAELQINVKDDGRGIDVKKVKNKLQEKGIQLPSWDDNAVLESLFKDDMSLAEKITDISGRGVGLSAVKALVEEHDGHIKIHTELGKGTTFMITLPYIKEPGAKLKHLPPVPVAS